MDVHVNTTDRTPDRAIRCQWFGARRSRHVLRAQRSDPGTLAQPSQLLVNRHGPRGELEAALVDAHLEHLGDTVHVGEKRTHEPRQLAQVRIESYFGFDQAHIAAARADVAFTRREDVLQPVDVGSVRKREYVTVAAPERIDGDLVGAARAATNVGEDGEPRHASGKQPCQRVDEAPDERTDWPQPRCGCHCRGAMSSHWVMLRSASPAPGMMHAIP